MYYSELRLFSNSSDYGHIGVLPIVHRTPSNLQPLDCSGMYCLSLLGRTNALATERTNVLFFHRGGILIFRQ